MAVAAETVRSPKSEIYGRSLSTIHRLGTYIVENAAADLDVASSPEAAQARVEFYTSVEEGFGTDPELGGGLEVRDFDSRPVTGGKVMAKDLKTSVSDMTEAGLVCAQEKVDREKRDGDRRFAPQLTRSHWDHENALIVDKMARGETDYNTRIVVSPFPEEAAAMSGDAYWRGIGYVPSLRRGFVQLYYASGGEVVTGSLSFDGSDKERLREIFCEHGIDIPETEITDNWLQYAITGNLSEQAAKALATRIADEAADPAYEKTTNTVEVTGEHREIMDTVFNESYVQACESLVRGYQTAAARTLILQLADKAGFFNQRYSDALYRMRVSKDRFSDDDMASVHDLLVYSTIEMMRALHLQKTHAGSGAIEFDAEYLQALDAESFQYLLGGFAADGAMNNRGYSACGLEIALGGSNSLTDNPQAAFGGYDREKLSWHGGTVKKGKCVNCHEFTDVGVQNWCRSCIKC